MKYLLDTNVYLEAFRSEEKGAQFRAVFFPLLSATFLSAVVAYELSVDARDRRTRILLREFLHPMERTGRMVAPTFRDWTDAADIVTLIEKKDRGWRSKLPALLNDVLIAQCARRIGATVITYNRADFLLIHRRADFSLRIVEG